MKFKLAMIAFAASIFLTQSAHAVTLRTQSPLVNLTLKPGQTYTGTIDLTNPGEETILVKVYLEDWTYKENGTGEKQFSPLNTDPKVKSAGSWMTYNPVELTVAPFSTTGVSYTIRVPETGVEGTYHAVIFFETAIGQGIDQNGAAVAVSARLGSIIVIDIEGLSPKKGTVHSITVTPPSGNKPAKFMTLFENVGPADVILKGNFMITDANWEVVGRGEMVPIYTQSGYKVNRESEWAGKAAPGAYNILFTFELGDGQTLVQEVPMTVE